MLGDLNDGSPKRQAYPAIRWVNTGVGQPIRPKQQPATPPSVGMKLMAPATRLRRRWEEGQRNIKTLHLELQQQGYPGAFRSLYRFVSRWLREPGATQSAPAPRPVEYAPRQVSIWLSKALDDLPSQPIRDYVTSLLSISPLLEQVREQMLSFKAMMTNRRVEDLDKWLGDSELLESEPLRQFVRGLRQDYAAVRQAFCSEWSNGQMEGQPGRRFGKSTKNDQATDVWPGEFRVITSSCGDSIRVSKRLFHQKCGRSNLDRRIQYNKGKRLTISMNVASLNRQLQTVYEPYLAHVYSQEWPADVSAPLLMHVFEQYEQMRTKVLFVDQETHGWDYLSKQLTVETLQNRYVSFNLGKHADYGDGKKPRYLRSPFWNFSRSCFHQLNLYPGVDRKTNGFLWTNISKFDCNSTTPHPDLQQRNRLGFELLRQELTIIQPNVVVFLTGTKYDPWLDQLFQLNREPILEGGLLNVLHDSTQLLPVLSFQTEHPRTLSMRKTYHAVLDKLVEVITYRRALSI